MLAMSSWFERGTTLTPAFETAEERSCRLGQVDSLCFKVLYDLTPGR